MDGYRGKEMKFGTYAATEEMKRRLNQLPSSVHLPVCLVKDNQGKVQRVL